MTTRSVYVMGGAGTGKSTWMGQLLEQLHVTLSEQQVVHSKMLYSPHHQRDYRVDLIGHRWEQGVYLGVMRENFPGADGLVRTTGPVAREWLTLGNLPPIIVGEGLLLSSRPFLRALADATDLTVVHLTIPEELRLERVRSRGHAFDEVWSRQTVSRAAKTAADLRSAGVRVRDNMGPAMAALWLEGW